MILVQATVMALIRLFIWVGWLDKMMVPSATLLPQSRTGIDKYILSVPES